MAKEGDRVYDKDHGWGKVVGETQLGSGGRESLHIEFEDGREMPYRGDLTETTVYLTNASGWHG